ncbi:hypothetical protein FQZ97_561020 [compost metagenome]
MALFGFQQWQLVQRLFRQVDQRLQQAQEHSAQALDAGALEQVGGVAEGAEQAAVGAIAGVQRQVELAAAAAGGQRLDAQARQVQRAQVVAAIMVEQHLEQRVVAEAALRLQGLHQLFERQVLVGLGVQQAFAGGGEQRGERQAAVDLAAQHLGVDEEADQPFGFLLLAAGDGHADAQVALAAAAVEQGAEGGEQQHVQRAAGSAGDLPQLGGERRRHGEFQAVATEALLRRTRAVGGQFQQRMFAAQARLPVAQLALALAAFQPLALPDGEVGVLDRQRRQLGRNAAEPGAIAESEFVEQQLQRGAVADYVVQGQRQRVFVLAKLD